MADDFKEYIHVYCNVHPFTKYCISRGLILDPLLKYKVYRLNPIDPESMDDSYSPRYRSGGCYLGCTHLLLVCRLLMWGGV